jgi:biotin carboxyl carrier protein
MRQKVFKATIGSKSFDIRLDSPGSIHLDDHLIAYDLSLIEPGAYSLILNGKVHTVYTSGGTTCSPESAESIPRPETRAREIRLTILGREYNVTVDDPRSLLLRSYLSKGEPPSATVAVRAPMPGLIVRIEVQAGQSIQPGQGLVVLEAMKMENEIKALTAGRVSDVHASPGKAVEKGELLVSLTQD